MIDLTTERVSRWMAARMTRRHFVNRLAQVAIIVAGGPSLAMAMARQAEARVCGQSGVSPKCATYDCEFPNSVWGWCWYANGGACCAGGGLKKICDCCTRAWPNVHGYCPSGTNVRCIVESCYADPRVQTVPLIRVDRGDPMSASIAVSAARFGRGTGGTVVIGDAESGVSASVAASVAGAAQAALLLTRRDRLVSGVIAEMQRLGAKRAYVVGRSIAPVVDEQVRQYGLTVERIGTSALGAGPWSVEVGRWVMQRTGSRRAVAVDMHGVSAVVAPAAGAMAGAKGMPVALGIDAAKLLAADVTYLVGPEMAARAGEVPGARPLDADEPAALARQVAGVGFAEGLDGIAVGLAPRGASYLGGLGGVGGVVLIHDGGHLDGSTHAFVNHFRPSLARAFAVGPGSGLNAQGQWSLQSALNHYDAHLLIGVSGQGLPVVSQPLHEREIGRARVAGAPPEDSSGGYWTSRANPDR